MALNTAIEIYEEHLKTLSDDTSPEPNMIIDVLIARDYVHDCLQQEASSINIDVLKTIKGLDNDLKIQLKKNEKLISQNFLELEEFKQLKSPLPKAWWWKFKKPVHILDKFDWLFDLGTLFCLGFSFSITIEIISRILEGEGDLLLSLVAAFQASVTLWIGKTFFTKSPGKIINTITQKMFNLTTISKHLYAEISFIIALIIAILTFIFRLVFIPYLSYIQNQKGIDNFQKNNISKAFYNFQKAINLNPQNIEAKYRLGELYDRISITQTAKKLYELGIIEEYVTAYNNLGRLLIKEQKYEQAFQLLKQGIYLADKAHEYNPKYNTEYYHKDKYSLLKNLGWVRYKQGYNDQSLSYLEAAVIYEQKLSDKRAAANCLLAKVLETDLTNNTNIVESTNSSQIDEIIKQLTLCEDKAKQQKSRVTPEIEVLANRAEEKINELKILRNQTLENN